MLNPLTVGLFMACTLAYLSKYLIPYFVYMGISAGNLTSDKPSIIPAICASLGFIIGSIGFRISQWARWMLIKQLLTYNDWIYNQRSNKTKAWGILLSFLLPKKWGLFTFQKYLPRYPLPSLDETCHKTLETVKPILSEKEYEEVCSAMQEFLEKEGPPLQKILEKRYNTEENWLIDLWNNLAYLAGRSPLPVNSNFCTLTRPERLTDVKQLAMAGCMIHHMMKYKEKLENETIPGMMIQGMIPICCDRYRFVFSHTRLPGLNMDEIKGYPSPKHIVIFRRGHMYELNMYSTDSNGRVNLLTPLEIQTLLEGIVTDADSKSPAVSPGVFTTMERNAWAELRQNLKEVAINAKSLEHVESSAFCVDLSEEEPQTLSEEFHVYLTGDCRNRWFDKSLNIIFNKNATTGLNNEHTMSEATVSGRAWEYALFHLRYDSDGNATHEKLTTHAKITKPRLLEWDLDEYSEVMAKSTKEYNALAADIDTVVRVYKKGKGEIKKQRISPDGFLQMAMQLTFYRLHGTTPKTYETAATRIFNKGRTETIRPVSEHSVAFTATFDDPLVPRETKIDHLKKAIKYQTHYKFDATTGRGVDRHLLGLYAVGKMTGKVPKLFTLKPFTESDRLSTSQSPMFFDPEIARMTSHDPTGGGFGALTKDGYGVAYFLLREHRMHFLITSYNSCPETGSAKFADTLDQAFDDMLEMLKENDKKIIEDIPNHGDGISTTDKKEV